MLDPLSMFGLSIPIILGLALKIRHHRKGGRTYGVPSTWPPPTAKLPGLHPTLAEMGFTRDGGFVASSSRAHAVFDGVTAEGRILYHVEVPTAEVILRASDGGPLAPGVSARAQGVRTRGDRLLGVPAEDSAILVDGDPAEVRLRFTAEARAAMVHAVTFDDWRMEDGELTWRGPPEVMRVRERISTGVRAARALQFTDRISRWTALVGDDPSPVVRRDAFRRMLADAPAPTPGDVARACEIAARDLDPTLRLMAAAITNAPGAPEDVAAVAAGLADDLAPLDGVDVLARFGGTSHVPALRALVESKAPRAVRERAEAAIAALQTGRTAGGLALHAISGPAAAKLSIVPDDHPRKVRR